MKFLMIALFMLIPSFVMASLDPASQGKKAEVFIDELGLDAIESLKKTAGNDVARHAEFERILTTKFDLETIGRSALGKYWALATDEQKKEYQPLFKKMVIDVYSERFAEYSNQTLNVKGSKPSGKKDILVASEIVGNGQPIKLDWRVRNNKIIDVIVEGVSMSVTQRNDFSSIIQKNGGQVSALIEHLKK